MFKIFFLILNLFFCSIVYAENYKEYRIDEVIFAEDGLVTNKIGKPINGLIRSFYENGEVQSETSFKNGLLDGVSKVFYSKDVIQYEIPYKKSKRDGTIVEYYKNGIIKSEFPFKNDIENGLYKEYNEYGTIQREVPFLDGHMEGCEKRYNEKGEVWLEVCYKNDVAFKGLCINGRKKNTISDKNIAAWNSGNTKICD